MIPFRSFMFKYCCRSGTVCWCEETRSMHTRLHWIRWREWNTHFQVIHLTMGNVSFRLVGTYLGLNRDYSSFNIETIWSYLSLDSSHYLACGRPENHSKRISKPSLSIRWTPAKFVSLVEYMFAFHQNYSNRKSSYSEFLLSSRRNQYLFPLNYGCYPMTLCIYNKSI